LSTRRDTTRRAPPDEEGPTRREPDEEILPDEE
jgi:hypothetical protein